MNKETIVLLVSGVECKFRDGYLVLTGGMRGSGTLIMGHHVANAYMDGQENDHLYRAHIAEDKERHLPVTHAKDPETE